MLQVVCWKWDDGLHPKKQLKFTHEHVNRLKNMVKRNLKIPHQFVCITDDPAGIDPDIKVIPLWDDYRELGGCYVRLKAFSDEMKNVIGEYFLSLDLDCVITGDITQLVMPLLTGDVDFKIWGDTHPRTPYNGSMWMMKAGARKEVWNQFTPSCVNLGRSKGYVGTDQAWIGYCLGENEARWHIGDGVYSHRIHFKKQRVVDKPDDCKIVFFHGAGDPSQMGIRRMYPWVAEHWY